MISDEELDAIIERTRLRLAGVALAKGAARKAGMDWEPQPDDVAALVAALRVEREANAKDADRLARTEAALSAMVDSWEACGGLLNQNAPCVVEARDVLLELERSEQ